MRRLGVDGVPSTRRGCRFLSAPESGFSIPCWGRLRSPSAVVLFLFERPPTNFATRKGRTRRQNRKQIEAMLLAERRSAMPEIVAGRCHMLPALTERWAAVNRTVLGGCAPGPGRRRLGARADDEVRPFLRPGRDPGVGAWAGGQPRPDSRRDDCGIDPARARARPGGGLSYRCGATSWVRSFSYDRLKNAIEDHPPPFRRTSCRLRTGRVVSNR